MLSSNCTVYGSKNSRFIKEQEATGILLGPNSHYKKIPILGTLLWKYKMNEIINKFLIAGHKFMPEMYLRQPAFTYSTGGPFNTNIIYLSKYIYIR